MPDITKWQISATDVQPLLVSGSGEPVDYSQIDWDSVTADDEAIYDRLVQNFADLSPHTQINNREIILLMKLWNRVAKLELKVRELEQS